MSTRVEEAGSVPPKLYFRIQEVATIAGVKPYVLRYWESEFPMLHPQKDENDQRRYRRQDVELVLEIRRLLYEERYTMAGARQRLEMASRPAPAPEALSSGWHGPRPAGVAARHGTGGSCARMRADVAALRAEIYGLLQELGG